MGWGRGLCLADYIGRRSSFPGLSALRGGGNLKVRNRKRPGLTPISRDAVSAAGTPVQGNNWLFRFKQESRLAVSRARSRAPNGSGERIEGVSGRIGIEAINDQISIKKGKNNGLRRKTGKTILARPRGPADQPHDTPVRQQMTKEPATGYSFVFLFFYKWKLQMHIQWGHPLYALCHGPLLAVPNNVVLTPRGLSLVATSAPMAHPPICAPVSTFCPPLRTPLPVKTLCPPATLC